MATDFDYVIVGSGAAGSILCNRLTQDPDVTVCVLECGPPDRHPYIHIPAGFIKMLFNPTYTWQFQTEPGDGIGGRRIPTTQGRTLAIMQVSGGSQSFNAVNSLRVLGRWMRMITIPNQSSVPMAYKEFDDAGRMKPGLLYDRVVDVCEELMKFTQLTRGRADYLVDRYSERKELEPERLRAVAADARAPSRPQDGSDQDDEHPCHV